MLFNNEGPGAPICSKTTTKYEAGLHRFKRHAAVCTLLAADFRHQQADQSAFHISTFIFSILLIFTRQASDGCDGPSASVISGRHDVGRA